MKCKSKTTSSENHKKRVQQHLEQINLYAAGIDIGSQSHFVAVPEALDSEPVREFGTFTCDLEAMANWLIQIGITTVAMESTGVYWIPAFELLESRGLEVILVNARYIKNVSGRKTDVLDCQWIQQLHTYGLLSGSFRPEQDYVTLRGYMRQRETLVKHIANKIQHMQKALRQMNLLLDQVVTDITSKTGMAIVRAILSGERNALKLASYRDPRCKNSQDTIARSLEGHYQEVHLFALRQSVELYDVFNDKLKDCDHQIKQHLTQLEGNVPIEEPPQKKRRKKNNSNALHFDAYIPLYQLTGVDLTEINGLDEQSVLKIVSETGIDMSKWPSEKQFTSWVGLSPNNKVSGGKVLSRHSVKTHNRAKEVFKMAAYALSNSKSALGAFYRRLRARLGAPKAINATARKLAVIFYKMLRYKTAYKPETQDEYEKKQKERMLKQLKQKAKNLGFELTALDPQELVT